MSAVEVGEGGADPARPSRPAAGRDCGSTTATSQADRAGGGRHLEADPARPDDHHAASVLEGRPQGGAVLEGAEVGHGRPARIGCGEVPCAPPVASSSLS